MIGISGIIRGNSYKIKPKFVEETNILYEKIEYKSLFLERRTLKKFLDDKVFLDTDDYIIVIEGVVFNKIDLIRKYACKTWEICIIEMYRKLGETFYNEFRGSFSGCIIDKKENVTIIFVDQIGDKPIYFYQNNDDIIFSSNIKYILKLFIENNISFNLDIQGAYSLLTHGSMLEDLTPFEGIKRLKAGHYIKIVNKKYEVKRFHLFSNKPNYKLNDDKIIDKLDFLFKQAIKRQWLKNKEYGFANYAPLSAGLDSRMTTWALSEIENNIVNVTYSQSNYLDEKIPKQISSELKNHLIFKPLDNGLSLFYLDEIIKRNGGIVLYGGPAQVWDTFKLLNHKEMGVIHTGMLGDVVVGTFYNGLDENRAFSIDDGTYSSFLMDSLKKEFENFDIENYTNQEIFNFYNRGFNGANMGAPFIFQEFAESYSPFYDVDFMEFCLTIPIEKSWKHYIYDKWVIEKYPEAAKYPHNGRKITITKGRNYNLLGKSFTIKELRKKVIDVVTMKGVSMKSTNHMNPFDYWYNTNEELKDYMDNYYQKSINLINNDELQKDMVEMYNKGTTMEKTQVLTLLSIVQNYSHNINWLTT